MRARWLAVAACGVLFSGCVKKPVKVVLPEWIAWCEGAQRTMLEPVGPAGEGGLYLEALRPCMKVMMRDTDLDSAGLVLGLTTNEGGELKAACVKSISFDAPPLLECVMRAMWTSGERLPRNLERQTYRVMLFLD